MSMYTTPLFYLNMGGEMLYVLQQRLKAQGIDFQKTTQGQSYQYSQHKHLYARFKQMNNGNIRLPLIDLVLDDVTAALLNPKILSTVFEAATPMSIACIRSTLECVALSSIMRLDKASMNKLFDLMIMLTKYQLTMSTGPREVVLLTLNHIDAMREIVVDENAQECVNLVHQMTVNLYGNMTMGKVWQTRNDCLKVLDEYCVRVSVLLRLGLQNNDGSFNAINPEYNERYTEYQDMLNGLKLNDTDCENCTNIGSFALFGNRGTLLGRNIYSSSYGQTEQPAKTEQQAPRDYGIRSELKMLEAQMGVEEKASKKTFNLHIFTEDVNPIASKEDSVSQGNEGPSSPQLTENSTANNDYKNTLNDKYADFVGGEKKISMNLLDLLDKVE